jgi:hypothetical protein
MYIEKKTDGNCPLDGTGPAVTKEVTFSKSGKTIYCDGKEFWRGNCIYGNYYCPDDQSEYWISGVKGKGSNRLPSTPKAQNHERHRLMNGG